MEWTAFAEEELKLLLDSSADDCDFLFPTILDGSSTGLEGATSLSTGFGQGGGSRPAGCRLEVLFRVHVIHDLCSTTHFEVDLVILRRRALAGSPFR